VSKYWISPWRKGSITSFSKPSLTQIDTFQFVLSPLTLSGLNGVMVAHLLLVNLHKVQFYEGFGIWRSFVLFWRSVFFAESSDSLTKRTWKISTFWISDENEVSLALHSGGLAGGLVGLARAFEGLRASTGRRLRSQRLAGGQLQRWVI